jgi:hypothetical protein
VAVVVENEAAGWSESFSAKSKKGTKIIDNRAVYV